MQIVIDISDEQYEIIKKIVKNQNSVCPDTDSAEKIILNGTPLPKGHGDLIDRSKIYKAIPAEEDNCTGMGMTLDEMESYNEGIDVMYDKVQRVTPIIEADIRQKGRKRNERYSN